MFLAEEKPVFICRDDDCEIEGIHKPHKVEARKANSHQPRRRRDREPCTRPLWDLPAPLALDESIERAISDVHPKHFSMLVNDVENDYGSLGKNRKSGYQLVHRHLRALIKAGRVLRVAFFDELH